MCFQKANVPEGPAVGWGFRLGRTPNVSSTEILYCAAEERELAELAVIAANLAGYGMVGGYKIAVLFPRDNADPWRIHVSGEWKREGDSLESESLLVAIDSIQQALLVLHNLGKLPGPDHDKKRPIQLILEPLEEGRFLREVLPQMADLLCNRCRLEPSSQGRRDPLFGRGSSATFYWDPGAKPAGKFVRIR